MPQLTLDALHAAYAAGTRPRQVLEYVAARVDAVADPGIFIHRAPADWLADEVAALGDFDPTTQPLWGVPFAVKDNIDVAGMPTTAACPDFAYVADRDATAVARLRAAGALLVGKTNLDQFATGLVGVRTPYPVPRNAIDPRLVPGGSSSGSAVATAHGLVTFALGTDTAGSGRVPAALNNLVGLKPTPGRISTVGVVPACRSLDCVSVFAHVVADASAVLRVLDAFDAEDIYARPDRAPTFDFGAAPTVAVPTTASARFCDGGTTKAAFDTARSALGALGAKVVEVDITPLYDAAALLYDGPWVAERYAAIRGFLESHPGSLHPVTSAIIGSATRYSAVDAFVGEYRLRGLAREALSLFDGFDALCVPSAPGYFTLADVEAEPIARNSDLGTYTNFVNLLGLAALTVPTGARADGAFGSVTLISREDTDEALAGLGALLHARTSEFTGATDWRVSATSNAPATAPPGYIPIAAVGAHLRGLPLNRQLTERGGCLVRETRTADCYRLYALPGTSPPKPGLLRVPAGTGVSQDVEVWALPPAGFASFVDAIPSPLGIGRVALGDGSDVAGFLVEAEAVRGAEDISHFGGWRYYLAGGAGEASDPRGS